MTKPKDPEQVQKRAEAKARKEAREKEWEQKENQRRLKFLAALDRVSGSAQSSPMMASPHVIAMIVCRIAGGVDDRAMTEILSRHGLHRHPSPGDQLSDLIRGCEDATLGHVIVAELLVSACSRDSYYWKRRKEDQGEWVAPANVLDELTCVHEG